MMISFMFTDKNNNNNFKLPVMLESVYPSGIDDENWLDLIYVMQTMRAKNFKELRTRMENFQKDHDLVIDKNNNLKLQQIAMNKSEKKLEGEKIKLRNENLDLKLNYGEVYDKYEGLKLKYADLKCEMKNEIGDLKEQLREINDRSNERIENLGVNSQTYYFDRDQVYYHNDLKPNSVMDRLGKRKNRRRFSENSDTSVKKRKRKYSKNFDKREHYLLKDNYATVEKVSPTKFKNRDDMKQQIFNAQKNAIKKATSWIDYIDECIK